MSDKKKMAAHLRWQSVGLQVFTCETSSINHLGILVCTVQSIESAEDIVKQHNDTLDILERMITSNIALKVMEGKSAAKLGFKSPEYVQHSKFIAKSITRIKSILK